MRQVFDPHFGEGSQAVESNGKRKEWVLRAVSLSGSDDMLSNLQLGELSEHVKNHRHANVLTFAQETELGSSKTQDKQILLSKKEVT